MGARVEGTGNESASARPIRRLTGVAVFALALSAVALAVAAPMPAADAGRTETDRTTGNVGESGPVAATERFGLDLLGTQPRGNVVISPDSVADALAMAGTGARGETAKQIAEVLHLSGPAAFDSVGGLQRKMTAAQAAAGKGHSKAPELEIANGLFVQQGYPLKSKFTGGLKRHFEATPEEVDFGGDPHGALEEINSWGSEHTKGLIPEMLSELPGETRLVLGNAVYMKAYWRSEFKRSDTHFEPFFRPGGRTSTKFMNQYEEIPYGSGTGYRAVELPYRASTLSLLVVMPVGGGLEGLESELREEGLDRIVGSLAKESVELSLPRFHLETRAELEEALSSLGMPLAFGGAADFSGITGAQRLQIAGVEHVAVISVDEKGTEAAATTGIEFEATSAEEPVEAVTFKANHPFLFFVRDDETGAVLFAGRVVNPAAAGS